MVIQANMSPKAIVDVWVETKDVFKKYDIPISELALEALADENTLPELLMELNKAAGSSSMTCTAGG